MSRRPMTKRVRRLHDMRAKWGDCYWKPGDEPHIEHECEQHEADLIEYENDVRVDFVDLLRAAPRAEALDVERLARAIEIEDDRLPFLDAGIDSTATPRAVAEQVANRYARLAGYEHDR